MPAFETFWRYQENSFVDLCGTTTEISWICENFLDTLLNEVKLQQFVFPDYGEIPYPISRNGYYYSMPAKYFLYEREEDFDRAGEILEDYTKKVLINFDGVGISLSNWKNKSYYSWQFSNSQ